VLSTFNISALFIGFTGQRFSILVSSAKPKAHALAQKHDGWRPDNGSRPDRRRNLLQKNLQNGQGRQLADDRFGFGVCFQHFSLFPQFVPIRDHVSRQRTATFGAPILWQAWEAQFASQVSACQRFSFSAFDWLSFCFLLSQFLVFI